MMPTVWQALAFVGGLRDGHYLSEERARGMLREIGMKKSEMDAPYPPDALEELVELFSHPEQLDKEAKEAAQWMMQRN
jgi:hypothetical protein